MSASRPGPGGELLLEVRAEEIPARMLPPAVAELAEKLAGRLAERGLAPGEVETAFTPRRLLLVARGLPEREPDREEQVIGPPVSVAFRDGGPTPAALGFARRCGVAPEALERVATDKGEYLAATQHTAGRPTTEVLAELLPEVVSRLTWAKTMRWGEGEGPWVRPVHGVVALFDGEPVPFRLFGIESGRETAGHPVLSPEVFAVADAADHRRKLAARRVILRPEDRRQRLLDGFRKASEELGGALVEDDELLDELAAICEIPGVLVGTLEEEFLELPREVLIASLRDHQSALTVEERAAEGGGGDAGRRLLPFFLTVMDRPDDPAGRVRAGNEWVVAARLADARFFYREDRKATLEERVSRLAGLTFHERLGSYRDKAERIAALADTLCVALGWEDEREDVATAARLAKADLTTEMVKEFTSLQGQVGGLYAREEGASEPVWQAIYDQYLPSSVDDPLPRGRVGQAVALADRLDTLAGIFGIGLVPTGSRDPFGLRRAAQGVVRIALEGDLPFDLDLLAAKAARLYREDGASGFAQPEEVVETLRPFLDDRVRHLLGRAGYAYDEVEAALAAGGGELPDLARRVAALHAARGEPDFLSVVLAAKRIANIIREHEEYALDPEALVEEAERDLHAAYQELKGEIDEAAAAGDYERGLARIAGFAGALDRFFVEVLVMDEDRRLRRNRISLLQAIHRVLSRVARLPEMVVEKAEYRQQEG
ncbi:MAG TPA: glycine--tRNA ligase subunit beta [Thermoanaerobaculia bacterium]|nr:glycine--tRNA ligase subunit beta [Thermoanaerobaculia bacterium]